MDKPRHPLVIRPWKTQQTQRNKWNAPSLKAGAFSEADLRATRFEKQQSLLRTSERCQRFPEGPKFLRSEPQTTIQTETVLRSSSD